MSIEERIAAYFDGELTPDQRTALETELSSNPELKKEFDFQSDIIDGIREARKVELKTMLNNVPVGAAGTGGSDKLIQYGSIVAISVIIGFGIYFFWPKDQIESMKDETPMTEELAKEAITKNEETPLKEDQTAEILTEESTDVEPVEIESAEQSPVMEESTEEPVSEDSKDINTESARPTIPENLDVEDTSNPDAPENNLTGKTDYGAEPIIAEINTDSRKYNFHYKFATGKLVLYGEFNETYEILDFMQNDEREVYLYYSGEFYPLNLNQVEIAPLKNITDQSVVTDLETRRKSGQ